MDPTEKDIAQFLDKWISERNGDYKVFTHDLVLAFKAGKASSDEKILKINSSLRASLNRLYGDISNGEHLTKEWITNTIMEEPSNRVISSYAHMMGIKNEKVKELEAQLKKMKCCANCNDYIDIDGAIKCHERLQCNNYDAWKMKQ